MARLSEWPSPQHKQCLQSKWLTSMHPCLVQAMKRHAESARLAVQEAEAPPSALAAAEDCQVPLDAAALGCA